MPPLTPIVRNLLIINVAVFALTWLLPQLGINIAGVERYLALYYPANESFHPVQLVTHFFVHGGLTHILFNMFGLVMFGPLLEHRFGSQRFLLLYLLSAAGAVLLHFGYTWFQLNGLEESMQAFMADPTLGNFDAYFDRVPVEDLRMDNGISLASVVAEIQNDLVLGSASRDELLRNGSALMQEFLEYKTGVPMVGASGALYGIVAAFAVFFPDFKLALIFLPIPIKARYFVPALLVIDLFLGIMEYSWDPIAHFAHLGGAIAGGVLAFLWYRSGPSSGFQRWN